MCLLSFLLDSAAALASPLAMLEAIVPHPRNPTESPFMEERIAEPSLASLSSSIALEEEEDDDDDKAVLEEVEVEVEAEGMGDVCCGWIVLPVTEFEL